LARFEPLLGYSNLEYDLAQGSRGKRDVHTAELLERLVGAPGIAVNNNAAAIYLALNELASGFEVVVSRGELIEIGDGFRIPEIMQRSGAILREVGTTNRTRIEDYRDAINERTRLLLRVHPSNFRMEGFTARPELRELVRSAAFRCTKTWAADALRIFERLVWTSRWFQKAFARVRAWFLSAEINCWAVRRRASWLVIAGW
jgi:seryl-tRNA(Sec) selenium transferase